jgi:exodeoxyribonuclease-5
MEWSKQQNAALKSVAAWLRDPNQQVFHLFGFAGTGKTSLARHFAEGVDGRVMFGAFTGKAAHVLRSKGCSGAATIHSMIYISKGDHADLVRSLERELAERVVEIRNDLADSPEILGSETAFDEIVDRDKQVIVLRSKIARENLSDDKPMFMKNPESEVRFAKLIVIDECSMVDEQMGKDLLSFGVKVLVLGDPAQLPPVGGAGFFTENIDPDVMLTDIHRQALDSPILKLATQVRNKERLALGRYGDSAVLARRDIVPEMAMEADQILVGRNNTRRATNRRSRSLLGFPSDHPINGDRLVCLGNNHDLGISNGAIYSLDQVHDIDEDGRKVIMSVTAEGDNNLISLTAHLDPFLGDEIHWSAKRSAEQFDYGYALTCHKSQGSQWDNVMVFDESGCFRADRHRWLYTAITRAAERLILVNMED